MNILTMIKERQIKPHAGKVCYEQPLLKMTTTKVSNDGTAITNAVISAIGEQERKEELIGQGSYSSVYKIQVNKDFYAVKQLRRSGTSALSFSHLDNVLNEITILQRINHKNIIKLFGKYRTEDHYRIILEHCNGGDLRSFIRRFSNGGHFPGSIRIRESFAQTQSVFVYLHEEKHIIHRDIKPANAMLHWKLPNFSQQTQTIFTILTSQNNYTRLEDFSKALCLEPGCLQVKIGDFGFARFVTPAEQASDSYGSPVYMAPEVMNCSFIKNSSDAIYDFKADIWSLGVTLYELLASETDSVFPFTGKDKAEILDKIKTGQYLIDQARLNLSPYCIFTSKIDFLNHCLQLNPELRASATQLLNHPFLSVDIREQRQHFKHHYSESKKQQLYPVIGGAISMSCASKSTKKLFLVNLDSDQHDDAMENKYFLGQDYLPYGLQPLQRQYSKSSGALSEEEKSNEKALNSKDSFKINSTLDIKQDSFTKPCGNAVQQKLLQQELPNQRLSDGENKMFLRVDDRTRKTYPISQASPQTLPLSQKPDDSNFEFSVDDSTVDHHLPQEGEASISRSLFPRAIGAVALNKFKKRSQTQEVQTQVSPITDLTLSGSTTQTDANKNAYWADDFNATECMDNLDAAFHQKVPMLPFTKKCPINFSR